MGKDFKFLRPKKIEAEVEKLDGTVVHLECDQITLPMASAVFAAAKKVEDGGDAAVALCDQMAAFFGGASEDYQEDYDVRTITQIIKWMTGLIKNPT